jgi:RNA polymerase sigma-70 factor (ECF subfamily)
LDYFSKIYDKYIDKIYKFVYLKTSNKEVAEDIVSDVFLSALNNIKSFRLDENSSFNSWIYKIAYNKIIDFYKKNENTKTSDI